MSIKIIIIISLVLLYNELQSIQKGIHVKFSADDEIIINRESFWKEVLLTRTEFGYNDNQLFLSGITK